MAFPEHWDKVYLKDLSCEAISVPRCEMKQGMTILKDVYVGEDFDFVRLTIFETGIDGKKIKADEIMMSKDRIISKAKMIKSSPEKS